MKVPIISIKQKSIPIPTMNESIQGQTKWCRLISVLLPIMVVPLLTAYIIYVSAKPGSVKVSSTSDLSSLIRVERRSGPGFTNTVIDGSIHFFGWLVTGANGLYAYACQPAWSNFFGWVVTTALRANLTQCVAAGVALLLLNWGNQLLQNYSDNTQWVYDDGSTTLNKRNGYAYYITKAMHMSNITANITAYHTYGHHPMVNETLRSLAPHWQNNVTFSAALVANDTSLPVLVGYVFGFNSTNYSHSVVTGADALDDAIETLGRFDGDSYTKSKSLVNSTLSKRDGDMWMSYTNWADNVGYISDLENWGEYYKLADDLDYDGVLDSVQQIDGCTSEGCYVMESKYCVGIGFSGDQGVNDAEVGEAYVDAYGGLDNDCMSA